MQIAVSEVLNRRLRKVVFIAMCFVFACFAFQSYWMYSLESHEAPGLWDVMLSGHGTAPGQYRIGVMFTAHFLSNLSHGHLAMRHTLGLLDAFFLAIALSTVLFLLRESQYYLDADYLRRCAMQILGFALLLYFMAWLSWFHMPETLGNFACLAVAAALLSGRWKLPRPVTAAGLLLVTGFLATIRADSGLSLNAGILALALLPGRKLLVLGRTLQVAVGVLGIALVLGIEFYIKHVMYPHNPYSTDVVQIFNNLRSPAQLFCMIIALAPWFLSVWLARRHWYRLEGWQSILVVASLFEFCLYMTVAMVEEVRVFLPYPLVLVPTMVGLMTHELLGEPDAATVAST